MMGFEGLGYLHLVAAAVLGGFIILDRLAFRRFLAAHSENATAFYKALRPWLGLAALALILSGGSMLYAHPELLFSWMMVAKLLASFLLLGMFFYCPYFSAKAGSWGRFGYRLGVLALVLLVFYLGRGII